MTTGEEAITEILIDNDISAFVAADWGAAADDFDADLFCGFGTSNGRITLDFPTLNAYRESWLHQAAVFARPDRASLARDLRAAQRLTQIELSDDRAVATKVFDGTLHQADGTAHRLGWTTFYLLRHDDRRGRWLITGFVGYLPPEWTAP